MYIKTASAKAGIKEGIKGFGADIGKKIIKPLTIGGLLIAGGAAMAGAAATAKEKTQQPLAPPTEYPPGY